MEGIPPPAGFKLNLDTWTAPGAAVLREALLHGSGVKCRLGNANAVVTRGNFLAAPAEDQGLAWAAMLRTVAFVVSPLDDVDAGGMDYLGLRGSTSVIVVDPSPSARIYIYMQACGRLSLKCWTDLGRAALFVTARMRVCMRAVVVDGGLLADI